MKNSYKIALGVAVAAAVVLAVVLWPRPKPGGVKVAVSVPLSGPVAAFSGEYGNGLRMGVEDGCRERGLDPAVFDLDVQDNAGSPPQAVSILEKQRLRGFDAYVSGTSDMSNAIAKELDVAPVPHLLVSFDAFMTGKGSNRMRILPHYKIEGPMYVKYARSRGAKRVFSITLNNSAIQEEFDQLIDPDLKRDGVVLQREVFDWGFSDYRTLALKARDFKPDLILINGFSVHILPSIQALRSLGLVGDGNVLCVMDFLDLLYNETPKGELAGVVSIAPTFEIPGRAPKREEWAGRYKARFNKVPNYVPAFAYDTGRLFVEAYAKDKKVSKEALKGVLPYDGVAGPISVDGDGDYNAPLGFLKVAAGGELVPID